MNTIIIMFFSVILVCITSMQSEAQTAPNKYWVQFTDKNGSPFTVSNPSQYLSQRAIQRRLNQGIQIDESDLPVNSAYVDSIISKGALILTKSKWFNGVTIYTTSPAVISAIQALSFVSGIVKSGSSKKQIKEIDDKFQCEVANTDALTKSIKSADYGSAYPQIHMVNGEALHDMGYFGQGMVISVIDAGFNGANQLTAFDSLWQNQKILGWKDFVNSQNDLFSGTHSHGMNVLSIIAANIPGQILGSAPKASFWLLRSEDASTEYLVEEDNWIAAAEFADSVGTDVINTSLGYNNFTDSLQNYTYSDMNGHSTKIARGVNMASNKGMLVVVSAGNDGSTPWHYITTPGDADSALTVGAVDVNKDYASFSSVGPASDGDIKPNITAMGKGTIYVGNDDMVHSGNGTSFSAPLICGLATCLWQANPGFTNMQIKHAIEISASQYFTPDAQKGYGIPDFGLAHQMLHVETNKIEKLVRIFPNPFKDKLVVEFYSSESQNVTIEIVNMLGVTIYSKVFDFSSNSYNKFMLDNLQCLQQGTYIFKAVTAKNIFQKKILNIK